MSAKNLDKRIKIMTIALAISLLIISISSSTMVFAKEKVANTNSEARAICNFVNEKVLAGSEIPAIIPYQNERFNIYDFNNNVVGHIIIEDGVITSMGCNQVSNPSYNVFVKDLSSVKAIFNSEDAINAFNKAKAHGLIKIRGTSFGKKIKSGLTSFVLRIAGWF